MRKYELIQTEHFSKSFDKLSFDIKMRFNKQFKKLIDYPYDVGDPLQGKKWFRELKNKKYRVYYMIYESKVLVLLVGVSEKKDQQFVIDYILKNKIMLKNMLEKEKIK